MNPPHVHQNVSRADLGGPHVAVAVTNSGSFAVVADTEITDALVGHVLDYADRLAELIPHQRIGGRHRSGGKHRAAS